MRSMRVRRRRDVSRLNPLLGIVERFFKVSSGVPLDEIASGLWNSTASELDANATLIEQYKIYVEMADRVSSRRALANTFFLTLNSAVITALAIFWERPASGGKWWLVLPWAAVLIECLAWFWTLRSYRQLNSAKYQVIGVMETRLPASPYWAAEWKALGEGRNPAVYWPLSHVEQLIPLLFAGLYTVALVAVLVALP